MSLQGWWTIDQRIWVLSFSLRVLEYWLENIDISILHGGWTWLENMGKIIIQGWLTID